MTPPLQIPLDELLAIILLLRSPVYRNLSRIHTERLVELEYEATRRGVTQAQWDECQSQTG